MSYLMCITVFQPFSGTTEEQSYLDVMLKPCYYKSKFCALYFEYNFQRGIDIFKIQYEVWNYGIVVKCCVVCHN